MLCLCKILKKYGFFKQHSNFSMQMDLTCISAIVRTLPGRAGVAFPFVQIFLHSMPIQPIQVHIPLEDHKESDETWMECKKEEDNAIVDLITHPSNTDDTRPPTGSRLYIVIYYSISFKNLWNIADCRKERAQILVRFPDKTGTDSYVLWKPCLTR